MRPSVHVRPGGRGGRMGCAKEVTGEEMGQVWQISSPTHRLKCDVALKYVLHDVWAKYGAPGRPGGRGGREGAGKQASKHFPTVDLNFK